MKGHYASISRINNFGNSLCSNSRHSCFTFTEELIEWFIDSFSSRLNHQWVCGWLDLSISATDTTGIHRKTCKYNEMLRPQHEMLWNTMKNMEMNRCPCASNSGYLSRWATCAVSSTRRCRTRLRIPCRVLTNGCQHECSSNSSDSHLNGLQGHRNQTPLRTSLFIRTRSNFNWQFQS